MIKETVIRWISGLDRRVEQYLIFEDLEEEHEEKLASLSGRERIAYEMEVLGNFLDSDYYNADFDVWPDEDTRIDSLADLLALAENDLEQKKLENAVHSIFGGTEEPEMERPQMDSQQNDFFQMMSQAFGVNSEYDAMESSMTEISEYLRGEIVEDDPAEDSLNARLAEMLDDHMDSF